MRCEKCRGVKHSVRLVDSLAVTARVSIFWDDQNREHRHDPAWAVQHFECSNGHAFMAPSRALPCPACAAFAIQRQQAIDLEFAEMQKRG